MKPSKKLKELNDQWYHTRGGAALLMTTAQHVYFEVGEIMLRLESLESERLYAKHDKFRLVLVAKMEECRKLLDTIYTNCLNKSTPLTDVDNKLMEKRGEIKRRYNVENKKA